MPTIGNRIWYRNGQRMVRSAFLDMKKDPHARNQQAPGDESNCSILCEKQIIKYNETAELSPIFVFLQCHNFNELPFDERVEFNDMPVD